MTENARWSVEVEPPLTGSPPSTPIPPAQQEGGPEAGFTWVGSHLGEGMTASPSRVSSPRSGGVSAARQARPTLLS